MTTISLGRDGRVSVTFRFLSKSVETLRRESGHRRLLSLPFFTPALPPSSLFSFNLLFLSPLSSSLISTMSDKYNHHTMPLPKPKGVPRAMTREQIALYAEWDPSLLQSNADEHTSPVRQPQQQTMSIMRKQKGNASGSPKPYSPSTFEEWKAAASVAHPTGTRENIASPSTAAGNSAGRTVTGQPSSRYGCREMGVQGEAHAGSDAWRHRSSFSSNAGMSPSFA